MTTRRDALKTMGLTPDNIGWYKRRNTGTCQRWFERLGGSDCGSLAHLPSYHREPAATVEYWVIPNMPRADTLIVAPSVPGNTGVVRSWPGCKIPPSFQATA